INIFTKALAHLGNLTELLKNEEILTIALNLLDKTRDPGLLTAILNEAPKKALNYLNNKKFFITLIRLYIMGEDQIGSEKTGFIHLRENIIKLGDPPSLIEVLYAIYVKELESDNENIKPERVEGLLFKVIHSRLLIGSSWLFNKNFLPILLNLHLK